MARQTPLFGKVYIPVMTDRRGHIDVRFVRTARDRTPARSVVTAQLMGDPPPGRSALDASPPADVRRFEKDQSSPSALAPRRYQGGLQ